MEVRVTLQIEHFFNLGGPFCLKNTLNGWFSVSSRRMELLHLEDFSKALSFSELGDSKVLRKQKEIVTKAVSTQTRIIQMHPNCRNRRPRYKFEHLDGSLGSMVSIVNLIRERKTERLQRKAREARMSL